MNALNPQRKGLKMNSNDELLSCLSCNSTKIKYVCEPISNTRHAYVECCDCGLRSGYLTTDDLHGDDVREDCFKRWNTRHSPTPPFPKGESFYMTHEQTKKADEWCDKQGTRACGTIGGRFTYSFSPTTLGVVVKVKDSITGKEIDLTDYENW